MKSVFYVYVYDVSTARKIIMWNQCVKRQDEMAANANRYERKSITCVYGEE